MEINSIDGFYGIAVDEKLSQMFGFIGGDKETLRYWMD